MGIAGTAANLTPEAPSGGRYAPRGALAGICLTVKFLYGFYFSAIGVLFHAIGLSFRLGTAVEGALFPASFGSYVCGVLLFGSLSDRFARKWMIMIGIAIYVAGLIAFAVAGTFPAALLASVLIGGGCGGMEAVASALAANLFPERSASMITLLQVAYGTGSLSSLLIVDSVLRHGWSWRPIFLALAAANVALFLLLGLLRVPPTGRSSSGLSVAALLTVARQRVFWLLCLAEALYVGSESGYYQLMPTYFRHELTDGARLVRWIAVFWIAMTAGRLIAAPIADRFRYTRFAAALALAAAIASALTVACRAPGMIILCVALTGLSMSAIFGLLLAEANKRFSNLTGTVIGAVIASGGVGGSTVPWLMVALATPYGWRCALSIVPAISVAVVGFNLIITRIPRES
jgi:fucose permease